MTEQKTLTFPRIIWTDKRVSVMETSPNTFRAKWNLSVASSHIPTGFAKEYERLKNEKMFHLFNSFIARGCDIPTAKKETEKAMEEFLK